MTTKILLYGPKHTALKLNNLINSKDVIIIHLESWIAYKNTLLSSDADIAIVDVPYSMKSPKTIFNLTKSNSTNIELILVISPGQRAKITANIKNNVCSMRVNPTAAELYFEIDRARWCIKNKRALLTYRLAASTELQRSERRQSFNQKMQGKIANMDNASSSWSYSDPTRMSWDKPSHKKKASLVLLTGRNMECLRFAGYCIRRKGFSTLVLKAETEIIQTLKSKKVSMVIIDISKFATWDKFCKMIRMMHMDMPILVLSPISGHQMELKAMAAGADDMLVKPVEPIALIEKIYELTGEDFSEVSYDLKA